MVGRDDLVRWFGEANVIRPSDEVLRDSPLPADAKLALRELGLPTIVGMPRSPRFTSSLTWEGRVQAVFERPGHPGKLYRIGSSPGLSSQEAICVDGKSGEVVWVSLDGKQRDCFVNSNLRAFIEFLYIVSRDTATFRYESDAQVAAANRRLGEELRRIDPAAFAHPENYWPEFLEAMTI